MRKAYAISRSNTFHPLTLPPYQMLPECPPVISQEIGNGMLSMLNCRFVDSCVLIPYNTLTRTTATTTLPLPVAIFAQTYAAKTSCNRCQLHDGLPHQCGWLFTPHEAKVLFGLRFALRILRRHEDNVRMEKSVHREEPILRAIGDTLSRIIKSFPSARERAGHPRKCLGLLSWATMKLLAG